MRYFLLLLFAYPCQAQYLDFSSTSVDGETIHAIWHEVYTGEETAILLSIGHRSEGSCMSDADFVLSFWFIPALINPPDHVYLNVKDDGWDPTPAMDIALIKTDSAPDVSAYSTVLTIDELKEMNSMSTFSFKGHDVPGITDATDEFIRQMLSFGPCS